MYTFPYPNKEAHAESYREERLRQESRQELVRQAQVAQPIRAWYTPLMRVLGRGLVWTGQRLQAADQRGPGQQPAVIHKRT
jgi:hypothetical protein